MKLAQLAVLNWGQIESRDYPLADMTLLTGETGAGKSTLLDAVQAVMTAAKSGLYAFNPGQQATVQGKRDGKSKRSLAAYAVGEDGKGNVLRPQGAHSYLAAAFVPDATESCAPFTAVLAVSAKVEGQGALRQAKEESLRFFIVEGQSLCCADFALNNDFTEVISAEKAHNHLRIRYGMAAVVKYDDKGSYLSRLYGLFTGRPHAPDTDVRAAARAFSRSISYREISSVDELVKTEMLVERDFGEEISQIMAIIRRVEELAREAQRLQLSIHKLEALQAQEQALRVAYREQVSVTVLDAANRHADALAECERHRESAEKAAARLRLLEAAKAALSAEATLIAQRRAQLIKRQSQSTAWQQIEALNSDKKRGHEGLAAALNTLQSGIKTLSRWQQRIQQWSQVVPSLPETLRGQFLPLLRAATPLASIVTADLSASGQALGDALIPDAAGLDRWLNTLQGHEKKLALLQSLLQPLHGDSLQAQMLSAALEAKNKAAELKKEADDLRAELVDAERGMDYPRKVREALPRLRLKFPDAEATVLADLVEPKEGSTWQSAIEGLMREERFLLFVKPSYEAPVIDWLKEQWGREAPAVAQGARALKDSERTTRLPANTIIEELRVSHPLAKAFITVRFGSTIKVYDTLTLTKTAQGLMQDGRSARSYQIRNVGLPDEALIFGLAARKARAEGRKNRLVELAAKATKQQQNEQSYRLLGTLLLPDTLPAIAEAAESARKASAQCIEAERQLCLLDRGDLADLEKEEQAINEAGLDNQNSQTENAEEVGQYKTEQREAEAALAREQRDLPALESTSSERQTSFLAYCKPDPALDATTQLRSLMEQAPQLSVQAITSRRETARNQASDALSEVKSGVLAYNREAQPHEQITSSALQWPATGSEPSALLHAGLLQLRDVLREQLRRQKSVGLAERESELDKARKDFSSAFSAHFCYRIKSEVDDGVATLKRLNKELAQLHFGNEVFQCEWEWLKQGKARYDYFDHLHQQGDALSELDLFAAPLTDELAAVRDELKNLLLQSDVEKARAELKRIADYREYRRYEVYAVARDGQKVALSKWGSGSGGELETPAYVVRAAICAEAFRLFHGSGPRLRLMMFDEAFSKIDAKRSKGLLSFLNAHLGMQILCAMPTRGAGALLPAFQRQYSFAAVVHKGEDGRELPQSLVQMKDFRSSALTALWEQRLSEVRSAATLRFEQAPEQLNLAAPDAAA